VTLFCCLPFGIMAIIKSAEVNSKWASGDQAGAQQSAADAGKWIKWAVIAGVLVGVLYLVFVVFLGALGASSN
jgi:predicted secreted protein